MHTWKVRFGAREATWLVLALGWLAMLQQGLPGRMSVDSVIELHEGRFHMRENWGPAIFPWILGVLDRLWPGTILYVILSSLLLYLSWAALPRLRGRAAWLLPVLAAGAVATPNILIYQSNVWHDVLYANAAVVGFLCLAFAARDWNGPRRPWLRLAAAVLALSVAGLTRQNGLVLIPMGAIAVGWTAWGLGWRRALAWGLGWLLAAFAVTAVLSVVCLPQGPGFEKANAKGFRALAAYDLLGAAARDPQVKLTAVEQEAPGTAGQMRQWAHRYYSPRRIDYIDGAPELAGLAHVSTPALVSDWRTLILERPDLYWPVRWEVFRWVFATPVIDACLPVYIGIDGPEKQMRELGMTRLWGEREQRIFNYATWFYDTPVLSHVAWAGVALALVVFLLARRDPADIPIAAMLLGAIGFTKTFFVLSLACDYRYLYFLDVAALTGLLYVAADPRLRRRTA